MKTFFPEVSAPIAYEGPDSKNPLAFKYYDANRIVGNKTMAEHLRIAVAYWHTFVGNGGDPFGAPAYERTWDTGSTALERAEHRARAAFEFFTKLGVNFYCFHDRDISPEGANASEYVKNMEHMTGLLKALQNDTGVKLLWGTSNLTANPRYTHGAATNPDPAVMACAALQVKTTMDATKELGGVNYVFWGGREGYETLLNTNMQREMEQMARFFHMVVDYAKTTGFTGQLLIEPKPKEPTKHMYDFDAATVLGFLRQYDLIDHFKLNIEANHATLAGHTFDHDLTIASMNGKLGSIDANVGDLLLGWDTDQYALDLETVTKCMLIVLKQGGLNPGGLNFDAKVRRGSIDGLDLFYGHIGSMDAFARGLLTAQRILDDDLLPKFVRDRYAGYDDGLGKRIMDGKESLTSLAEWAMNHEEPQRRSGRQEMLENLLQSYF
ncbi:xylose isomerase [Desulfovibrio inopinatus]|uniref:xylose isomerase n=1 Tax=Desulfovibrio inopinatus TaxID=102109 RepID=UPI0003FC2E7E|nr:xylose isomerase [Desulfovibrio inopinatus]